MKQRPSPGGQPPRCAMVREKPVRFSAREPEATKKTWHREPGVHAAKAPLSNTAPCGS